MNFKFIVTMLLMVIGQVLFAGASVRPDIVIFINDDQSQKDCSPYGGKEFITPNMELLASRSLLFTSAFVASPSCAPSRAALLTGLMPARNGAEANHAKPRAELKKWPAYFQELGYEVVAFGKVAHYRQTGEYGFDVFGNDTFHDHGGIEAAVEFLKKRATTKPLCLFVGSNWPHVPWPEEHEKYDPASMPLPAGSVDTPQTRRWRARYGAAVTKADDDLGVIYKAVRKHLPTGTLFILTSDHGAQWPFAKWNLYDTGTRVPLLVEWPGITKSGSRTGAMVSWVDLLPTLLEAAGGQVPQHIDGRSFLPVLQGKSDSHREQIFTTHSGDGRWNVYPMRSVRNGKWKYILNLHPEFAFTTHIDLPGDLGQRGYWRTWETSAKTNPAAAETVKRYHERPREELYDLASDPDEQDNLAPDPQYQAQLEKMRRELEVWMQEQGDQKTVFAKPRLLSDPTQYGPGAEKEK